MIDNPKTFYPFLARSKMGKDAKRHSEIDKTFHVAGMAHGVTDLWGIDER
jgi:hypothetical protein